jgi:hypothetical protein
MMGTAAWSVMALCRQPYPWLEMEHQQEAYVTHFQTLSGSTELASSELTSTHLCRIPCKCNCLRIVMHTTTSVTPSVGELGC